MSNITLSIQTRGSTQTKPVRCREFKMSHCGIINTGKDILFHNDVEKTAFKITKKPKLPLKEQSTQEALLPDSVEADIPLSPSNWASMQMLPDATDDPTPEEIARDLWEPIPEAHGGRSHTKKKTKRKGPLFTHHKKHL